MKEPQDRKRSMKDVLAAAKLVEKSVSICLSGDLQAQFEDLNRELQASIRSPQASLASGSEHVRLADEIEAVERQMAEFVQTFTFRALPAKKFSDLRAEHPGRPGKDEAFNLDTFGDALLAACCIDPVMTLEEAVALGDVLSNAQYMELVDCAFACNARSIDVPFSPLASQVHRSSATS